MTDTRQFTLKKRRASHKDYSHNRTHGIVGFAPPPKQLLFISRILDQGQSEHCTAYACTAIRESMKMREYDPELFWNEEAAMYGEGKDSSGGVTLETAGATCVEKGFIPIGGTTPQDKASAYVWLHKEVGMDMFDTVRHFFNEIKVPLNAGLDWYSEWDYAPDVPFSFRELLGGHDVKLAGIDDITCNGERIVVQGSWGEGMGTKGLWYFNRATFNKAFDNNEYGMFYLSDDPDEKFKRLGLINALYVNLINLWRKLKLLTN